MEEQDQLTVKSPNADLQRHKRCHQRINQQQYHKITEDEFFESFVPFFTTEWGKFIPIKPYFVHTTFLLAKPDD